MSTQRLLDGPVLPTLLRLTAPNMAEALARVGFITLDAYYVAWLGPEPLAGISLVFPVFILMQTMSAGGMGGGVSSAIARALGAGRRADADALVLHAAVIALVMAALFTVAGLLLGPALYRLMGATAGTLASAVIYSTVMMTGAAAVWLMNTLANAVRGTGNMIVPAMAIVIGGIIHMTLSPALILGWGPLPRLGVAGAAVAGVAAYAVGSAVLLVYLTSGRGLVRLTVVGGRFQRRLFSDILGVGLPSSLATIQFQLINFVLVGAVGGFGTLALAGYGAATRLEMIQVPVVFGFGAALVTMVGTNVGAGQMVRARRVAWVGAMTGAAIGGSVGLFGALFAEAWMTRFAGEPEVVSIGVTYLRIVGPSYLLFGVGLALYFAAQGARQVLWPFVAITGRLVLTAVGVWVALAVFGAGLTAIFVINALGITLLGLTVFVAFTTRLLREIPSPSR